MHNKSIRKKTEDYSFAFADFRTVYSTEKKHEMGDLFNRKD